MKVQELAAALEAENLTSSVSLEKEVHCGYCCDLLSWVLAHGENGMAWCTVQNHINVVAVAVLMEMSCIILTEGVRPEKATLDKAIEEKMPILATNKTSYEVSVLMGRAGIPASER